MLVQVGLGFALLFLTVLISQMVRLGPLLFAAVGDPQGFAVILLDILPRIVVIALPFSLPLGAFLAVDRLERRQVSQQFAALGAPPRRVWLRAAMLLGIWMAVLITPVAWLLEAQAARAFPTHALQLARESVIAKVAPGRIARLSADLAVLAGSRDADGTFRDVTVLSGRDVLAGHQGKLSGEGLRLELTMRDAELWRHGPEGLRRASADELRITLPASRNIARHLGFFHHRDSLDPIVLASAQGNGREARLRRHVGWRRILTPLTVLLLPIFGVGMAVMLPAALRLVTGILVTVSFVALYVASESLTAMGAPALLVGLLPAVIAALCAFIALRSEAISERL
jgi:hypothetical protein